MIPIPHDIWDYNTAYAAAEAAGTEIDVYMRGGGMGVRVLDDDKLQAWVDEYVSRCIDKIKGEGPEVMEG